jgi:glucokinase
VAEIVTAEIAAGAASPPLASLVADGRAITARDVFAAAAGGDTYACGAVRRTGEHLAVAVVNLVNLLDPQRVIIGGGLTHTGHLLVDAVREGLARWTALHDAARMVVPAALGADTGPVGAMAVALRGSAEATG